MPSLTHEALIQLFRDRPELAPELMRDALGVTLPAYTEVRTDSAELTHRRRRSTGLTWSCCSSMGSRCSAS